MRQVPYYAIIGNGRMARHFCHYFELLQRSYGTWSRKLNTPAHLDLLLNQATHALILINDDAIDDFILTHPLLSSPSLTLIHCSGSLHSKHAYAAHPLQTFSSQLYTLADYEKIPFIIENNSPSFQQLLPGLNNPHYRIHSNDKPYYHALCVMAHNFTTLLWQKFFTEMENKFHINPADLQPFLMKTFHNIANNPATALTGPLQRKDKITLQNNIKALSHDNFLTIFKAFVATCLEEKLDEKCH